MDRGQILFLSFAAAILLYQMVKGWRLGLVRQLVRFGALAAAYIAGFWGSATAAMFLHPLGYPDFILQLLGGAGLGLVVYLFICLVGGVLFKRTAHQDMGFVWFVYGLSGALMGVVFALVLLLVLADSIRLLGSIAEADSVAPPPTVAAKPPKVPNRYALPPAQEATKPKARTPLLAGLVELKQSLEKGVTGEVLQTLDPVPKKFYSVASKTGRVVSNLESAERFMTFPGAKELADRPAIQALREDPEILRTLRDGNYRTLLQNEKVIKAANDPKTAALIKQFDLEKALDHALAPH